MKKHQLAVVSSALLLALVGCGPAQPTTTDNNSSDASATQQTTQKSEEQSTVVAIKPSPDKYTWYMKNYVGMNASAVGYASLGGQRMDRYGAGAIKIVFVTKDGTHVPIDDDEALKQYIVSAQSYEPNTEIKYTFQTDSEGEEYDNLIDSRNIEEIVLSVDKVGENGNKADNTLIQVAPDKYTAYVRDYVGRNLADCGYVSLGGNIVDSYSAGYVTFNLIPDDGAAIDLENADSIARYKVTAQDVAPNSAITLEFLKDSDGNEYSNLVDHQSIQAISLYLTPVDAA